jgi:molybdenum cofactor guanylyltransferase
MTAGEFHGAVLAGGFSRRMGRDKATLGCAGEPLWRRQCRVLRDAGAARIAIVRRADQPVLDERLPRVCDAFAGAGPLAGLHAALLAADAPWLAVLAVDMPRIEAAWFRRLQARCRPGVGAVARHDDGCEPLAAIYPCEALASVGTQLRKGRRSAQELVDLLVNAGQMAVVDVSEDERAAAENWNTPESVDSGVFENSR